MSDGTTAVRGAISDCNTVVVASAAAAMAETRDANAASTAKIVCMVRHFPVFKQQAGHMTHRQQKATRAAHAPSCVKWRKSVAIAQAQRSTLTLIGRWRLKIGGGRKTVHVCQQLYSRPANLGKMFSLFACLNSIQRQHHIRLVKPLLLLQPAFTTQVPPIPHSTKQ
eukprot:SAG11_NODE_138_length_15111_cov_11.388289_7_plen_167_part_00